MAKPQIIVNKKVYQEQLGAIATAMSEMDDNSPESFQIFIDKMVKIGAIEIIPTA